APLRNSGSGRAEWRVAARDRGLRQRRQRGNGRGESRREGQEPMLHRDLSPALYAASTGGRRGVAKRTGDELAPSRPIAILIAGAKRETFRFQPRKQKQVSGAVAAVLSADVSHADETGQAEIAGVLTERPKVQPRGTVHGQPIGQETGQRSCHALCGERGDRL